MVAVTKAYAFTAADGSSKSLADLFDGRRQLVVQHFMFDPSWDAGCRACSVFADQLGHLSHLHSRDTTFAAVSRAPIEQIEAFKKRMGWTFPWYSSAGSDFNYDFHATLDPARAPVAYNFQSEAEMEAKGMKWATRGEQPGASCFLKGKVGEGAQEEGAVYHTYSAYARGTDSIGALYGLLDLTALGRQDEKFPHPMAFKYHDEYKTED